MSEYDDSKHAEHQESPQKLLKWLRTQIGKNIKVEFLIGTNMLIDREGSLLDVGSDYILLKEIGTNDTLSCDAESIKFIRIYSN